MSVDGKRFVNLFSFLLDIYSSKLGNAKEFCSRNPGFPPILILYDIINGLHYLHSAMHLSFLTFETNPDVLAFKPEIVHGDIKAAGFIKETHIVSADSASSRLTC